MVSPHGAPSPASSEGAAAARPAQARRGGVVNVTRTVTDTGARKEMFGHTARRIKMSLVTEAGPDSCNPGSTRVESDGWYIDFQYDFACSYRQGSQAAPANTGCDDEVRTRTVGTAKHGYPVQVATTVFGKNGEASVMSQEVLKLSREPLDASLFEVPAGYALARDAQQLYAAAGAESVPRRFAEEKNAAPATPASGSTEPGTP
jgi:hypothetical protein